MDGENLRTLGFLNEICRRHEISSLAPKVRDILEYSSETDHVDVVILGRFKAGKSSLLNTLLGRDVLPIDVLPATAVITRIMPGSTDRATVVFENHAEALIGVDEIARFVTEKENPDNVKRVARVDVALARTGLLSRLHLVDTPGVGSIHRHNTEASRQWLPRVGAALIAISVDQPFSENDLVLLQELAPFTPLITIVLTKADLLESSQLQAVEEYVRRKVAEGFNRALRVMSVSIRAGHEKSLERLRLFLENEVAADTRHSADAILRHKTAAMVDACRSYMNVTLAAAEASQDARAELSRRIAEERKNIWLVDKELSMISGYLHEQALNDTEKRFLAHRGELTRGLQADLARKAPRFRGNLSREAAEFRNWLGASLETSLTRIGADEQDAWRGIVEQADVGLNRVVRAFKDRLAAWVRRALGVEFAGAVFEARLEAPRKPSLRLGRVFDTHIDELWFLIPMTAFRPLIHRQFRRTIAWEVEKNLYRLSSQWTEAIASSIRTMMLDARQHVHGELDTICALVDRASAIETVEDIRRDLQQLERITAEWRCAPARSAAAAAGG